MGCLAGKKKATSKTRKVAYVFIVSHHSVFIKAMHSGGCFDVSISQKIQWKILCFPLNGATEPIYGQTKVSALGFNANVHVCFPSSETSWAVSLKSLSGTKAKPS